MACSEDSPASLLLSLQGGLLRSTPNATGRHFSGLGSLGRSLRLSNCLCKRLGRPDAASAYVRHIARPFAEAFFVDVMTAIEYSLAGQQATCTSLSAGSHLDIGDATSGYPVRSRVSSAGRESDCGLRPHVAGLARGDVAEMIEGFCSSLGSVAHLPLQLGGCVVEAPPAAERGTEWYDIRESVDTEVQTNTTSSNMMMLSGLSELRQWLIFFLQ
jgi:hypothetical protein